jgi:hypothetical protein
MHHRTTMLSSTYKIHQKQLIIHQSISHAIDIIIDEAFEAEEEKAFS